VSTLYVDHCDSFVMNTYVMEAIELDAYLAAKPWGHPDLWPRAPCSTCGVARRFYCPTCVALVGRPPLAAAPGAWAAVDPLPLRVEVVLRDDPTKATGVHAAVLAPGSVRVRRFPGDLDRLLKSSGGHGSRHHERSSCDASTSTASGDGGFPAGSTVVLFPSECAVSAAALPLAELAALRTVVVVDSKWQKTGGVLAHPALQHLRRVKRAKACVPITLGTPRKGAPTRVERSWRTRASV